MNSWQLYQCREAIEQGGIIAYPTEAVYGLGCSPWCRDAVYKILRLKQRSVSKGLILVAADISQFHDLIEIQGLARRQEILDSWPGPVTWVVPAKPGLPRYLTGSHHGLAVRVSAHPIVRQLCTEVGILVSTSANPGGHAPARTPFKVRNYFGNHVDYILPGQVGSSSLPTEIRNALHGNILRKGH